MPIARLTDDERNRALKELSEWSSARNGDAIIRAFSFADFSEAFAFMTRVALLAETQNHHPEWSNVYSRVEIVLTTHDADGLSQLDIIMARSIDALV